MGLTLDNYGDSRVRWVARFRWNAAQMRPTNRGLGPTGTTPRQRLLAGAGLVDAEGTIATAICPGVKHAIRSEVRLSWSDRAGRLSRAERPAAAGRLSVSLMTHLVCWRRVEG